MVFREIHDSPLTGGHFGLDKAYVSARQRYWWPHMYSDLKEWIRSCSKCQQFSPNLLAGKQGMIMPQIAIEHNQRVVIDIKGPYPTTDRGNKLILTITDMFTRWPEAYPMRYGESEEILNLFVNEYITRFGMPDIICTDQGKSFLSKVMKELCDYLMIHRITSTPYHPQLQGQDEATNKNIGHALRKYCSENPKAWDLTLPLVMFSIRVTISQTGDSPYYNLYHHDPRFPLELTLAPQVNIGMPFKSKAAKIYQRVHEAYQHIMDHTE